MDSIEDDFDSLIDDEREDDVENSRIISRGAKAELFGPDLAEDLEEYTNASNRNKRSRATNKLSGYASRLMGLANVLYAQGDHKAAKAKLQQVILSNPNAPSPYHTLGLICEENGEMEEAAQFYMLAAELSGKDSALWRQVGEMFIQLGNYEKALKCYSRAIRQNPADQDSLFQRGLIYSKLGELKRAIGDFSSYLEKEPQVLEVYKEMGRIYHLLGERDCETEILKQGFNVMSDQLLHLTQPLEPNAIDFDFVNMYAESQMGHKQWKEVLELVNFADQKRGHLLLPLELVVKRAICNIYLGDTAAGQIQINHLLTQPAHLWHDLYWELAQCLMECMIFDQALHLLTELLMIPSYDHAKIWMKIYYCYKSTGDLENALVYCKKCFEVDKTNVNVCLALADLYHQMDAPGKGIQVVEEYDQIMKDHHWSRSDQSHSTISHPLDRDLTGKQVSAIGNEMMPHFKDIAQKEDYIRVWFEKAHLLYAQRDYARFVETLTPILRDRELIFIRQMRRYAKHWIDHESSTTSTMTSRFIPVVRRRRKRREKGLNTSINHPAPFQDERDDDDGDGDDEDDEDDDDEDDHGEEDDLSNTNATPIFANSSPSSDLYHRRNMWELVGMSVFLQLLIRYGQCLVYLNQADRSMFSMLDYLHHFVNQETAIKQVSNLTRKKWRLILAKVAYASDCYTECTTLLRQICAAYPNNQSVWNFFYKATSKSRSFFLSRGFVLRLLEKYPNCASLLLLSGHMSQMSGSHRLAVLSYLRAYALQPKWPLILLSTGVALLNFSMSRKNPNRHITIIKAFAFLSRYFIEHVYGSGESIQEAYYNMARAFHQLQLFNFAIPLYEWVIHDAKPAVVDQMEEDLNNNKNERSGQEEASNKIQNNNIIGHLKREAAYNLSLIYRSSGAHQLARQLLRDYLTI